MMQRKDWTRPQPFRALMLVLVVCAPLAILAGCREEHRITLDEFRQMQRRQDTPAPGQESAPLRAVGGESFGVFRVGPGDVLSITVSPADQLGDAPPVRQRVQADGRIDLPMAGSIEVANQTLLEAERSVKGAYVPEVYRDAIVHVEVLTPAETSVMVLGAVARPGLVPVRRNERNLLHVVNLAGGISESTSGEVTLRRLRTGEEKIFDIRTPRGLTDALAIAPLEDGDIVIVQSAQPNTVFVGGLVLASGPQVYPQGTRVTALQALAAAGGIRPDLFPEEITLIRRVEGKDVHVKMDVDRLMCGEDENLLLAEGDILWVPHTAKTRIIEFVNNTVYIRTGIGAHYTATYTDIGGREYGDFKNGDGDTIIVTP